MSFLRVTPFALLVLSCSGLKAGDVASPSDAGADAAADAGDDGRAFDAEAGASSDFFVDVKATGAERGTQASPFHTITAAASAARASSASVRTLHVAAGMYDVAHGEVFPIDLHGGISIIGAGSGVTIVSGRGWYRTSATGGVASDGIAHPVAFVVGDPVRPATFAALTLLPSAAAPLDKSIGILCDQGNAPQPGDALGEPTLVVDRVVVGPNFAVGLVATTTWTPVASGCNARVTGSAFSDGAAGIWAVGCNSGQTPPAAALAHSFVALRVGDGTAGNTFRRFALGGAGAGVVVWSCASSIDVHGNGFADSETGILMIRWVADTAAPTHVSLVANTFDSLRVAGVWLNRALVVDELRDNSFSGIPSALLISGDDSNEPATFPAVANARGNQFVGNGTAVALKGVPNQAYAGATPRIDFGRAGDPGNNVFRCNSSMGGAAAAGYDVILDASPKALASTSFVGNFWDHAPPTTVTAATAQTVADGTDVVMLTSTMNASIDFSNAQLSSVPCPAGRTPGP